MMRCPAYLTTGTALLFCFVYPEIGSTQQVDAKLETDMAWVGEPVTITITLYSPGPFSGTASFDLPELPQTAVLPSGSPVVGNETVNGESLFTQRHQLKLFTQQSGEVVIPSFTVRFAGKKSFLADPEPMQGSTPELRFESKRPAELGQGVVLTVTEMTIDQLWSSDQQQFQAGDVIQRTITRAAAATTAMMFPPIEAEAMDGIRTYTSDPVVEDTSDRGETKAKRVDTLKYQFERAGTFELPSLEFTWWDPKSSSIKSKTVAGRTFTIEAGEVVDEQAATPTDSSRRWEAFVVLVFVVGLAGWLVRQPIKRCCTRVWASWNHPQAVAARRVRSACQANQAKAAYAALLDWKRIEHIDEGVLQTEAGRSLQTESDALARHLFGSHPNSTSWSGGRLRLAFDQALRAKKTVPSHQQKTLPALNPTSE